MPDSEEPNFSTPVMVQKIEQLSSRYDAGTAQVFGDLGYRIDAGHTAVGALAFEPFANLAYVNLRTDGFSGTGAAALTGRSGMAATARGGLGGGHGYGG